MKQQLNPTACSPELSRLISAAVVNKAFCRLLLRDPAAALESGYLGESFRLPPNERALVLSIQASSLADFVNLLFDRASREESRTSSFCAGETPVSSGVHPVDDAIRALVREKGEEIAAIWNTSAAPVLEPA